MHLEHPNGRRCGELHTTTGARPVAAQRNSGGAPEIAVDAIVAGLGREAA